MITYAQSSIDAIKPQQAVDLAPLAYVLLAIGAVVVVISLPMVIVRRKRMAAADRQTSQQMNNPNQVYTINTGAPGAGNLPNTPDGQPGQENQLK